MILKVSSQSVSEVEKDYLKKPFCVFRMEKAIRRVS